MGRKTVKMPLCIDGELICPHCKTPLLLDDTKDDVVRGEFVCLFCGGIVSKLSEEILMKMLDDFPKELLREWMIEMR